jgi:hypothetical protein
MPSVLNSREWATAIWLALGIVACLTRRDLRSGFRDVLVVLLKPKLALPVLAMVAYIAIVVSGAAHLQLWESDLTGGTLVWFFGSALALFFNSTEAPRDPHYMRAALARAARVTVLVEAFVNFYVLPLGVELLLVPAITVLAATAAVAEIKPELEQARVPLNFILRVLGLGLLLNVTVRLASSLSGPSLTHLLRALALPMWLSVALLPFTYMVGLLATYELAFLRLRFAEPATPQALRRAKLALVLGAHGRAHDLAGLGPPWTKRLVSAPSPVDARHVVAELRAERAGAPRRA